MVREVGGREGGDGLTERNHGKGRSKPDLEMRWRLEQEKHLKGLKAEEAKNSENAERIFKLEQQEKVRSDLSRNSRLLEETLISPKDKAEDLQKRDKEDQEAVFRKREEFCENRTRKNDISYILAKAHVGDIAKKESILEVRARIKDIRNENPGKSWRRKDLWRSEAEKWELKTKKGWKKRARKIQAAYWRMHLEAEYTRKEGKIALLDMQLENESPYNKRLPEIPKSLPEIPREDKGEGKGKAIPEAISSPDLTSAAKDSDALSSTTQEVPPTNPEKAKGKEELHHEVYGLENIYLLGPRDFEKLAVTLAQEQKLYDIDKTRNNFLNWYKDLMDNRSGKIQIETEIKKIEAERANITNRYIDLSRERNKLIKQNKLQEQIGNDDTHSLFDGDEKVKYYLKRIMDEKIEKIAYEQAILWQKATEKNEHIKGLNKEMDRINTKYKKLTETLFAKMMRDTHKRSENDTDGERQVPWEGWTIEFSRQVWNYASLTAERWENNIPWRSRERQNSELGKIRINKELPELPPEAKLDKAGELLEIRMREIRERTEKIAQEDERLKLEEKRLELENAKLGIYKMAGRLGEFGDKMDRMEENYTTYDTDKKELKRDMTSVNRDCEQFVSELNNLAKEAEEHSIDLDKKDWYISLVRHTPPNFTYFEE